MVTEIICIIDRSGSMSIIRDDAIGGFNTFLEEQKKIPGEASLTLVQFDTEYEIVHENKHLTDVPPLTIASYIPRGATALLDAIGKTIDSVGLRLSNTPKDKLPAKVIVAILTDGEENSSKQYTNEKIKSMIEHQTEKYSWEFIFLGANQDAFATAGMYGIPVINTVSFVSTGAGVRDAYTQMSNITTSYRS
jgi:uncharacterized protein YegL